MCAGCSWIQLFYMYVNTAAHTLITGVWQTFHNVSTQTFSAWAGNKKIALPTFSGLNSSLWGVKLPDVIVVRLWDVCWVVPQGIYDPCRLLLCHFPNFGDLDEKCISVSLNSVNCRYREKYYRVYSTFNTSANYKEICGIFPLFVLPQSQTPASSLGNDCFLWLRVEDSSSSFPPVWERHNKWSDSLSSCWSSDIQIVFDKLNMSSLMLQLST